MSAKSHSKSPVEPAAVVPAPTPIDPIVQDYEVRQAVASEIARLQSLLASRAQLTPLDFSK